MPSDVADSHMSDAVVALLGAEAGEVLAILSRAAAPALPHDDAIAVVNGQLLTEPSSGSTDVSTSDIVGLAEHAAGSPAYGVLPATKDGRPAVVFVAANRRAAGAILVLTAATASTEAYRSVSVLWEIASDVLVGDSPAAPTAADRTIDSEWRNQLRMVRNETAATLRSILGTLRSRQLDDTAARQLATAIASQAVASVRDDTLQQEPTANAAFTASAEALRPMVQHSDVELQLAPPEDPAQIIPALVGRVATVVARGVILAMLEYTSPRRIRVGWSVTTQRLLLNVRDDGDGAKFPKGVATLRMRERLAPLGGSFAIDAVADWGTGVIARIPLDAPESRDRTTGDVFAGLTSREREVLDELVAGHRNRQIADTLGLSEHTVKFHVHRILVKLGAGSRGEAAAVARAAMGLS